jgi:uncharacterized membrane protein
MNPLNTVRGTIIAGIVLAIVIALLTPGEASLAAAVNAGTLWLHVLSGITWLGLLYYFNFVQVPALGEAASDDGGPGGAGITKYVAPRALWWFRWGAAFTWVTGASYLAHAGLFDDAFALGMLGDTTNVYAMTIGFGAWLGTFMLFNVWILIWPNQKKILGMVEATADEIAKGKRIAFLASRSNTLMSIPMVMSMVGAHHGFMM